MGSVFALFAGLVHPDARQPPTLRLRHQGFIASKLVLAALALGGAPVFVAVRGVPDFAEAVIFALVLVQVAAAMLVVRGGHLASAQLVAVAGLAGIALAAAPATGALLCSGCWLVAAAVEAILSASARLRKPAFVLVACLGGCVLAAAAGARVIPGDAGSLLFAAGAGVPILLAATWAQLALRATEAALTLVEGRTRALVEASDAAAVALDATGAVTWLPPAGAGALDLAGLSGRGLFEHVQVADRPAFLKLVSDAAHGCDVHVATLRLRRDAEPARPGEAAVPRHVTVEMRAARGPAGVVAVIRDVPAMRRDIEAPDATHHLATEAMRSRDEFLANMSHELRTPLNAVIGFSEMLSSQTLRPCDPEKQRDYARIILQSGQHLLSVVNAILDMSKIRSGSFALVPERFDVAPLVDQCCEMVELKAEAGLVTVTRDVPADIEPLVADRRACRQILINLLSNAVKFTPENGRVTIGARMDGDALRMSVADTGIGIAAADVAKLGQPFFQVNGSIRRTYEGTGLGLSVVRGLVELHGGLLAIDSVPGRGTTVSVRLPLHHHAPVARPEPTDPASDPASDPLCGATVAPLPQRRATPDNRMRRRA